jgi:hypothetical protein
MQPRKGSFPPSLQQPNVQSPCPSTSRNISSGGVNLCPSVYYILENIALEDICSKFKSVLFISAFDMVHDPVAALETLLTLGFERVLTSGCDSSALEGLPLIKRLIDQVQAISFLSSSDCGYS